MSFGADLLRDNKKKKRFCRFIDDAKQKRETDLRWGEKASDLNEFNVIRRAEREVRQRQPTFSHWNKGYMRGWQLSDV